MGQGKDPVDALGDESELLDKADALMAKHRGLPVGPAPAPPATVPADEIPLLTEVVDELPPPAAGAPPRPGTREPAETGEPPAAVAFAGPPHVNAVAPPAGEMARQVFEEALQHLERHISESIEQRLSPRLVELLADSLASMLTEVKQDLSQAARETVARTLESKLGAALAAAPAAEPSAIMSALPARTPPMEPHAKSFEPAAYRRSGRPHVPAQDRGKDVAWDLASQSCHRHRRERRIQLKRP